jgi:hypothetical protein
MSSYLPVRAAASRIACGTSEIGHLSLGIFDKPLEEPDDVKRRLLGVACAVAYCRVRHRIAADDESILVRASFHLRA